MEFGILIDFKNLELWTKNYAKPFVDCFTKEYTMKYLKKFADDRFTRLIDELGEELTDKQYRKYNDLFRKYFVEEMQVLIATKPAVEVADVTGEKKSKKKNKK